MSQLSIRSPRRPRASATRRECEFGDDHVSWEKYEEKREALKAAKQTIEEKEAELLEYHNQCAELQTQRESAEASLKTIEKKLQDKQKDCETLTEEYNKLVEAKDKFKKEFEKQEQDLRQTRLELRDTKLELSGARKRERSADSRQQSEAKRLQKESQDLRNRNTIIEKELHHFRTKSFGITPPPPEFPDLAPLFALHPRLTNVPVKDIAKELVDVITYNLNDVWSYLPHEEEEALVTPATQDLERIFKRLRNAVSEDSQHLLKPRVQQLEQEVDRLVRSIEANNQARQELIGERFDLTEELRTLKGQTDLTPITSLFPETSFSGTGRTPTRVAERIRPGLALLRKANQELARTAVEYQREILETRKAYQGIASLIVENIKHE